MQYLKSFKLVDEYKAGINEKFDMRCFSDNPYPFRVFPQKQLYRLDFTPVTMLYGGNGSGKSTLLNIIAEKLKLDRSSPFNNTPFYGDYIGCCDFTVMPGKRIPEGSRIITSDDVFDYLLDLRAINEGIDTRRDEIFREYAEYSDPRYNNRLQSLDDLEQFRSRAEAKKKRATVSSYTSRRIPHEVNGKSNGESAFAYFTTVIKENALYLLDEPENSLSAKLQNELVGFISDSVRFYGCQFVISTHSPFLLSMKDALIYDLDSVPVCTKKWTELENVREYYRFFEKRRGEFEDE